MKRVFPCTVESVLGIAEEKLVQLPDTVRNRLLLQHHKTGRQYFLNQVTGELFPCGELSLPTLGNLREQLQLKTDAAAAASAKPLPPLVALGPRCDIGEFQATLKSSDKAMVQVASNFNCLEVPHYTFLPTSGKLCDFASTDHTQGPAAVFGPLPSYIYRTHFAIDASQKAEARGGGEEEREEPCERQRQQAQLIRWKGEGTDFHFLERGPQLGMQEVSNINLLTEVRTYFGTPTTGKLYLSGNEAVLPDPDAQSAEFAKVVDSVCLGLHQRSPIMWGRSRTQGVFAIPPLRVEAAAAAKAANEEDDEGNNDDDGGARPVLMTEWNEVDQVFSASINLRDIGSRNATAAGEALRAQAAKKGTEDPSLAVELRMAHCLVRASYEGIYLAALLQGTEHLYLTLIGGGVFGNPLSLIVEEINRAHKLYAGHPCSRLKKVTVCLFGEMETVFVGKRLMTV